MNIYSLDDFFDTSLLKLGEPVSMKGNVFFCKILYNKKPLYIRTNRCCSKDGVVGTKTKTYCDLVLSNDAFPEWILDIEERCKQQLISGSEDWFEEEITENDIEYYFNSSIKSSYGGKQLLRVFIQNKKECLVFDENESILDHKEVLNKEIVVLQS